MPLDKKRKQAEARDAMCVCKLLPFFVAKRGMAAAVELALLRHCFGTLVAKAKHVAIVVVVVVDEGGRGSSNAIARTHVTRIKQDERSTRDQGQDLQERLNERSQMESKDWPPDRKEPRAEHNRERERETSKGALLSKSLRSLLFSVCSRATQMNACSLESFVAAAAATTTTGPDDRRRQSATAKASRCAFTSLTHSLSLSHQKG